VTALRRFRSNATAWPPEGAGGDRRLWNTSFSKSEKKGPPPKSLKIWSHLRVFFVADSVHLFQIIGAPEWARVDDSARHYRADTRY
jgi:hypothetical protein